MSKYEAVIGLEVHAELMTNTKMFTGSPVVDVIEADPNVAVRPLCLGMPGTLPVVNMKAIELSTRVGLALNCTINLFNKFDRKNYFYPDLPKSYQISQFDQPIAEHGYLDITLSSGEIKRIGITRVHMEEDTGKLTHQGDGTSLVDYNRAGIPLLEIVSEPDINSAEEAYLYATKLRQILRYLEVNTGELEKGVLRVEPNISVRPAGTDQLNTRTEVKNLNSFRSLLEASEYEIKRQIMMNETGGRIVQETRGWNQDKKETFSQRSKENAHDYRYFPDPDLPPLQLEQSWVDAIEATLPELPDAKKARYAETLTLDEKTIEALTAEQSTALWFEEAIAQKGDPKAISNYLLNNIFKMMNDSGQSLAEMKITPASLVGLTNVVAKGTINKNIAKEVIVEMFESGKSAEEIIKEKGLAQVSDTGAISETIRQILTDNPSHVADYLGGRDKVKGFFVGQVMRAMRGKANPGIVNKLLDEELEKLR